MVHSAKYTETFRQEKGAPVVQLPRVSKNMEDSSARTHSDEKTRRRGDNAKRERVDSIPETVRSAFRTVFSHEIMVLMLANGNLSISACGRQTPPYYDGLQDRELWSNMQKILDRLQATRVVQTFSLFVRPPVVDKPWYSNPSFVVRSFDAHAYLRA